MKKITPGHACGAPTKFSRRIQRRQARGICMPLRVRNQRSAGPLPDDSRSIVHAAPKEPPLGRASPFGVRPFRAGSAGPNPCRTLLMRDAPLFQCFSFPGNAVIIPRPGYLVNAKIPAAVWRRGKGRSGFPREGPLPGPWEPAYFFRPFLGGSASGAISMTTGLGSWGAGSSSTAGAGWSSLSYRSR